MPEIIDLSQEIYSGMPVFPGQPEVSIRMFTSHEERDGRPVSEAATPAMNLLEMGEHSGTHVDALNHMGAQYRDHSIETMPLSNFFTDALCLDLSAKGLQELIEPSDLERALNETGLAIQPGETVLIYTDHFRRAYGSEDWKRSPGLSAASARWLGQRKVAAFGVETISPGVRHLSNREVHQVCGEMGFTHYENLVNLHLLVGRGRFLFIGFPLKIRGGTGSPVRAVAVFGEGT